MRRIMIALAALVMSVGTPSITLAAVAYVDFGRSHTQWVVAPDQLGLENMISQIADERGNARVLIQCDDAGWVSFVRDGENSVLGYGCGMETASAALDSARQACLRDGGRQGYCSRVFTRYDNGNNEMEPTNASPIDALPDARMATEMAERFVRIATLAEACSMKTGGEFGAPVLVIRIYYAEATAQFTDRFGVATETAADTEAIVAATLVEADNLLRDANPDEWPSICNDALGALYAAWRGDFDAVQVLSRPE